MRTDIHDPDFEDVFKERFEAALIAARPELVTRPSLPSTAMACLILNGDNQTVWSDTHFQSWGISDVVDPSICSQVRLSGDQQVAQTRDGNGRPLLLTYAPLKHARNWPINFIVTPDMPGMDRCIAIGALSFSHLWDDVFHTARAMGMTNLQAKVSAALVSHGALRKAAIHAGVTYQTARKAISQAMQAANVSGQTALVRKLTQLASMAAPPQETAQRLLIDIFGVTDREAGLCLLLAEGYSRGQAAKIAGLSNAVAKDCYSRIFEALHISHAPEIPGIIMDAFASSILVNAEETVPMTQLGARAPLRLVARPDASLIAVSDYGPVGSRPVLIIHSSLSTRHPLMTLVTALQDAGFRPVTIDRPGFGMTDNIEVHGDPFACGTDDITIACDRLDLGQIDVVTRGGSFAALALARSHPQLVGRVIAINPDLLQHHCSKRSGILGIVRTGFDRFPDRIEAIARWLAAQLTPARANSLIEHALRNSPIDQQAFAVGSALADYQKSVLVFATGRIAGFVREQTGYALLQDVEGIENGKNWTLLMGESDPIHEIPEICEFWAQKLPGAKILCPAGAARFIELTHTDAIVQALKI